MAVMEAVLAKDIPIADSGEDKISYMVYCTSFKGARLISPRMSLRQEADLVFENYSAIVSELLGGGRVGLYENVDGKSIEIQMEWV